MMDERMEEKAALHVLGALSETEAREFKQAMRADPELKNFVAGLTTATGALAGALPLADPPPQLRAKILAQVAEKQKLITMPERKPGWRHWLPWAFATCLAVLCMVLFAQDSGLRKQIATQTDKISSLDSLAGNLQAATNELQKIVFTLQEDVRQTDAKISAQAEQISSLTALANTLQSATNDLQQTVLALEATNRLANLKIAMLNSLLADAPTAVAVTLWDDSKQEGVFVVQHLKPLPADKDYQLWVMENGTTPVDAGVFRVDANGGVRVDFKAKQAIKVAGKFAVTEETHGGVASPTIKNMVLVGG
jgi:anti-sigma-K factor RskA